MFNSITSNNLAKLIKEYQASYGCGLKKEYDYYRKFSLEKAVELAFKSEYPEGKIHPHQRRIGRERLNRAAEVALENIEILRQVQDFADVYNFVEIIANSENVSKIGLLAKYDIASRIAANCGITIDKVYCHAGTTEGARALGLDVKNGDKLFTTSFPSPLNQLSAEHIENFLCIYKSKLQGIDKVNSCSTEPPKSPCSKSCC